MLSFYKKNVRDCIATGSEKIDDCADSCIIDVLVMGVMLLNQRNISYFNPLKSGVAFLYPLKTPEKT